MVYVCNDLHCGALRTNRSFVSGAVAHIFGV